MAEAVLAGGVGLRTFGAIQGAQIRAEAAAREAQIRQDQAFEIEREGIRDAEQVKKEGRALVADQKSSFAKGGFQLSGSSLLVLESTKADIDRDALEIRRISRRRADLVRRGANLQVETAEKVRRAEILGSFGSVLTSGAQAGLAGSG